ncbi:MAG: hypothetical protein ACJAY8_001082 [Sphingobacteriales bacterium]|jgi:hypothetical protein
MEVKKYIESGILESYLFGELDNWQRQEVESLRDVHPEINEALLDLEIGLEEAIQSEYSKKVNPKAKDQLMKALFAEEKPLGTVKSITETPKKDRNKLAQFITIAAALTGIVWGGFNEIKSQELKADLVSYQRDLVEITQSKSQLIEQVNYMETKTHEMNQYLDHINRKSTHLVNMGSPKKDKNVKVYWCENSKTVFLKVVDLPALEANEDYQLWRLVDGKPIDMGVIERKFMGSEEMMFIENVEKVHAFAITIEPKGGQVSPTLEKLQVLAEI